MRLKETKACFALCFGLLAPAGSQANDWYVAPSGTPAGPGTPAQPYDLTTALSGSVTRPGDTIWLRGGSYTLKHLDTQIHGAPGQPITFRPMPGESARIDGSITFYQSAGNVVLRELELYSSDTNRLSAQAAAGFNPSDITIIPGIASYVPDLSFINLVVHDQTRHGFYLSDMASNNLVYGCLVYNNGWASPDNAEGHGMYVQGASGPKELADNLVFNNSGANMHVYENAPNRRLVGITLDGNVAFNAGMIQNLRSYRDWIVGVDAPAINADGIVLKNNMGYYSTNWYALNTVQIGRDGVNGSVALLNNYLPQGLAFNNWTIAAVAGNSFMAQWTTSHVVSLNQTQVPLASAWNGNTYALPAGGRGFSSNSSELGFTNWQNSTGYDLNSASAVGKFAGTKVFIRPNRYQAGRANLIVYNWDNLASVSVDVSSVLVPGAAFEVRNAENFFAGPVLQGIFDGSPLNLPMTGLTVASPTGLLLTPPPTGPTFNVFILLPSSSGLQASQLNGQVQVSWPTSVGRWVLQSASGLEADRPWVDVTNPAVILGDRYQVTVSPGENRRVFRLRSDPLR